MFCKRFLGLGLLIIFFKESFFKTVNEDVARNGQMQISSLDSRVYKSYEHDLSEKSDLQDSAVELRHYMEHLISLPTEDLRKIVIGGPDGSILQDPGFLRFLEYFERLSIRDRWVMEYALLKTINEFTF